MRSAALLCAAILLASACYADVSFNTHYSCPIGARIDSVAVADFNGETHPDLAVACPTSGSIILLFGDGSGAFETSSVLSVGGYPASIVTADFNGDTQPDLAVTQGTSISLLLGRGAGTFEQVVMPVEGIVGSAAFGNFNGDAFADLALGNSVTTGVKIIYGGSSAPYLTSTVLSLSSPPTRVVAVDLDSDGRDDIFIDNDMPATALQLPDGTFAAAVTVPGLRPPVQPIPYNSFTDTHIGDFNGDGHPDIAAITHFCPPEPFLGCGSSLAVYTNDGDGNFTGQPPTPGTAFGYALWGADLNGDGADDLVDGGSVFFGDPASLLVASCNEVHGLDWTGTYAIHDLNNDLKPDLIRADFWAPDRIEIAINTTDCFGQAECRTAMKPDLWISYSTATLQRRKLQSEVVLLNLGCEPIERTTVLYALSKDETFSSDDVILKRRKVKAAASTFANHIVLDTKLRLPRNTPAGQWLLVVADPENTLDEFDEFNNMQAVKLE